MKKVLLEAERAQLEEDNQAYLADLDAEYAEPSTLSNGSCYDPSDVAYERDLRGEDLDASILMSNEIDRQSLRDDDDDCANNERFTLSP